MRILQALLVGSLFALGTAACADDGPDRAAAGTVVVKITGIEDSIGHDVAAVMFDGLGTDNPDSRGIGGFGVKVDADPFSTTQTIATPESIDVDAPFPHVSREPLVAQPGEYTVMIWIADGLGGYSRWVPGDSPALGGCRVDVTVEAGRPTNVTVAGIPPWTGTAPECSTQAPSTAEQTSPPDDTEPLEMVPDADGTPVAWEINLDDLRAGVHTISMIVDFGPMPGTDVKHMSGTLIWDQVEVALCGIDIRYEAEEDRLGVGDIFQTIEGCKDNPTVMQDAFDEFGPPDTACVAVTFDGTDQEFCAPLTTAPAPTMSRRVPEPGTSNRVTYPTGLFATSQTGAR